MVAGVEIEFPDKPTNNELHFMTLAAEKLTKDPFDIQTQKSDDFPKKAHSHIQNEKRSPI